jgi:F-type H+-transporting ATPase subunit epsilon
MHIEVVTPAGTAVATEADEVVAPGSEGEFGVLPGHTAFLSAMKPGVLRYRQGGAQHLLAVGPGLVEVTGHDSVIVLVERVAKPESIDAAAARKQLEAADAALKAAPSPDAAAEAQRAWAQAQLDALKR